MLVLGTVRYAYSQTHPLLSADGRRYGFTQKVNFKPWALLLFTYVSDTFEPAATLADFVRK